MNAQTDIINRAFSKQSSHYDADDESNIILRDLRKQVYAHLNEFLCSKSKILELNAGTGIDAVQLVETGHRVHAIDVSEGMIDRIRDKITKRQLQERLTCELLSYTELDKIRNQKFNYIFSNFGGLNCVDDLTLVTNSFPRLLTAGSFVTLVIMPPYCPWELASAAKGSSTAFRRLKKNGIAAHLEGEYFQTYYHSFDKIRMSLGSAFSLVKLEGLASLSPPPHRSDISTRYPRLYAGLRRLDKTFRYQYPFNRWADHIIVTFQFLK